ncbi:MAG: type II toxin-antitoxin system VapC family toxin [Chloroflexi bacterium]|nr:type II toxin-antitoxin system VapC family toxin [Chloroflexota bacterium]
MIVLDTNVVSELMRPDPSSSVMRWLAGQSVPRLYLSTVSEAELRYVVETLPEGERRTRVLNAVEGMLTDDFAGRILPFDRAAAHAYAAIAAARRAAGHPIIHVHCQIAAIARCRGASVATRDVAGFEGSGIEVIDPWADR